jgi:hypothetical protein
MPNDIRKGRLQSAVVGLILICAGGWLTYQIFYRGIMSITSNPAGLVFMLGPTLFFFGMTALIRGIVAEKRGVSGKNVLYCGLLMFIIGIYPIVYTPYLVGDQEAEVAQWLGQFIRISTGYPGILLSVIGFFIRNWRKD